MERMTVRRADNGKWAIANNDGANPTEQMLKIPKAIDRLAEYEDICPDPAHIAKQLEILKFYTDCLKGVGLGRLGELATAEREGRLLEVPCKFGDTVYRVYDDCIFPGDCGTKQRCQGCDYRNVFVEPQAFCLSMLSQNGKLNPPYYLTRVAAEARRAELTKKEETPNA